MALSVVDAALSRMDRETAFLLEGQLSERNIAAYEQVLQLVPNVPFYEGDWYNALVVLPDYLGKQSGLRRAVHLEDQLVVRLLIASGLDPSDSTVLRAAVQIDEPSLVRVLLEQPSVDPSIHGNNIVNDVSSAAVAELLLEDERLRNTLTEHNKRNLVLAFAGRDKNGAIHSAIVNRQPRLLKLLLERDTSQADLMIAIAVSDPAVLAVLLAANGPFDPDLDNRWLLELLAIQEPSVVAEFLPYVDDMFVSSLLAEAAMRENGPVVRLVLDDNRANPHMAIEALLRLAEPRIDLLFLLVRDSRTDVQAITNPVRLALLLEPLIGSRVMGWYTATRARSDSPAYTRFLRTLILKRLSAQEAVQWLIDHPIAEQDTRENRRVVAAYTGYFDWLLGGSTDNELALGLIGAQSGTQDVVHEYNEAVNDLFRD